MKIFIACLGTETNTFSPLPTGEQTFRETMLFRGDGSSHPDFPAAPLRVWRRAAEERQMQVAESLCAFAQPAGITVRRVYEGFRDEILADLRRAMPVDVVLLNMHGAMVADGYDDCEGDMLRRVREVVGEGVTVGLELDLHCSITPLMTEHADAIVTFKEYPHVDPPERAVELFEICLAGAEGRAEPVIATHDTRMISMWRTPVEPMKGFVERMQSFEGRDGILSVSFAHGFPWGDVPQATAKMLVIADGDEARAQALAEQLGREIWDLREACQTEMASIEEAMVRAEAATAGPVVLADVSDNAGGGAPSDSTFLLRAMVDRGLTGVLSGLYWDPVAVRFCMEAGEGASFELRIGGKCGAASGDPVDLAITVKRIVADATQSFGRGTARMGDAVLVSAGGIDLVLNSIRTQTFHPNAFEQFGIDVADYRTIAVKSTQHFYAGFAPVAAEVIYVAAPGAIQPDFAAIPFESLQGPYWPKVEDPFNADG
ncbi:MAG: M81 family metallopeptidase [Alphaproteobacteria bacterium]|nr:M81 family metallopeptidase [Alphaproteobacteria bacterium]